MRCDATEVNCWKMRCDAMRLATSLWVDDERVGGKREASSYLISSGPVVCLGWVWLLGVLGGIYHRTVYVLELLGC